MSTVTRYLTAIVGLIRREPVRTFAILRSTGFVVAAFWPGLVSPDQTTALLGLAVAWLGIDELVRQQTTSTVEPTLTEGTEVKVITPAGEPNRTTTV
jgi:hypothetical protein